MSDIAQSLTQFQRSKCGLVVLFRELFVSVKFPASHCYFFNRIQGTGAILIDDKPGFRISSSLASKIHFALQIVEFRL